MTVAKGTTQVAAPDSLSPGWRMVRFGDVVRDVNEATRDPEGEGLERFVGLEHLDGENLHIRRWGLLGESETTFTKRFRKGQVLFGKRRAYQRKVAVAEFDGLCSSDILTFEPKGEDLIPELLPFIVQSEGFFAHALGTSSGSLSPRTRWSQLADHEFPLPPKDDQRGIAAVLLEVDHVTERFCNAFTHLTDTKRLLINKLTTRGLDATSVQVTRLGEIASHWQILPLEELISVCQYGLSIPLKASGQYPILRMMNYDDGVIVANDLKHVDLSDEDFATFRLQRDDILFNRTNSADLVGKVGIFRLEGDYVFASYLVRLRAKSGVILPDYLNYYLNSDLGQRRMLAYATPGVSQTNISAGNLRKVPVPVPPLHEQESIVAMLRALDDQKTALVLHHERTRALRTSLLSRLLSPPTEDAHVQ